MVQEAFSLRLSIFRLLELSVGKKYIFKADIFSGSFLDQMGIFYL